MKKESKFDFLVSTEESIAEPVKPIENGINPKIITKSNSKIGKRGDNRFTQVSAYIEKKTHTAVKMELLKESNS